MPSNICKVKLGETAHQCVLLKNHKGFHKACCHPLSSHYDGFLWADGTEQKKQSQSTTGEGKLIEPGEPNMLSSATKNDWSDGLYA